MSALLAPAANGDFDLRALRAQFPILSEPVRSHRLAYLDNAATTQKPLSVLHAVDAYYRHSNANVHRAIHELGERATQAYEASRDRIAQFINASRDEIVFTRGTTESINLVANAFLAPLLKEGDEILVTYMEHHSNIVPWQLIAARCGARLVAAPVTDAGALDLDAWRGLLNPRTRMVAIVHISNTLGTINPVAEIIAEAHRHGVPVVVDGAQALAHLAVDVKALDVDFYAASAHKAYGPTGMGMLYGKRQHLEGMVPWMGGGDMIRTVGFDGTSWNDPPYRFEAGTPHIAGAIGFAAGLDFIESLGFPAMQRHEHRLLERAEAMLADIPGLRRIGTSHPRGGILSFVMEGAHPQDIGSVLDQEGVAVRTGHHCTMPLMERYQVPATVRASLAVYNGEDDIDQLELGLRKVVKLFA
jgi:cysteine desulfurase/selenocysteine lyase